MLFLSLNHKKSGAITTDFNDEWRNQPLNMTNAARLDLMGALMQLDLSCNV